MTNQLTKEEQNQGYRLLFDGGTLTGWDATLTRDGWGVEDGCIVCTVAGDNYLYTEDTFEDFELNIEFKIDPEVNSGIFFRWSNLKDPVNTGLELQVLDTGHKEVMTKYDCGAVYDLMAPSKNSAKPAGEWNHANIKCEGSQIVIHLNGEKVIDMDISEWSVAGQHPDGTPNKFTYAWSELPRRGHIGLQDHGGRVFYRNIKIREH
jgi:hypothetical protein